ncbi:MAG: hypothetical protein ACYCTB_07435 [bacterium]
MRQSNKLSNTPPFSIFCLQNIEKGGVIRHQNLICPNGLGI